MTRRALAAGVVFAVVALGAVRAQTAPPAAQDGGPHAHAHPPAREGPSTHAHPDAPAGAPYAGQEVRDIKALSAEDVDGYLAGRGMGLAKAAELNGYAGPAHVLELAAPLALSAAQRERTAALFAAMQSRAMSLGRALVDEERALDRLFATRSVTPRSLQDTLGRIGALQAQLRAAHLEAHLAQAQVLTPEQSARYAQLRGYRGTAGAQQHDHGEHGMRGANRPGGETGMHGHGH